MTVMAPATPLAWDGIERRKPNSCRRRAERRSFHERRYDPRSATRHRRRGFRNWLRSLVRARVGVDRRKNIDQRVIPERRRRNPASLLTREELADLLK